MSAECNACGTDLAWDDRGKMLCFSCDGTGTLWKTRAERAERDFAQATIDVVDAEARLARAVAFLKRMNRYREAVNRLLAELEANP